MDFGGLKTASVDTGQAPQRRQLLKSLADQPGTGLVGFQRGTGTLNQSGKFRIQLERFAHFVKQSSLYQKPQGLACRPV